MLLRRACCSLFVFAVIASVAPIEAQQPPWLGIELNSTTDAAAIKWVTPNSPAQRAGLLAGDIVVSIDGQEVDNPAGFSAALAKKSPGTVVRVRVMRNGAVQVLNVTLAQRPAGATSGAPATGPVAGDPPRKSPQEQTVSQYESSELKVAVNRAVLSGNSRLGVSLVITNKLSVPLFLKTYYGNFGVGSTVITDNGIQTGIPTPRFAPAGYAESDDWQTSIPPGNQQTITLGFQFMDAVSGACSFDLSLPQDIAFSPNNDRNFQRRRVVIGIPNIKLC